MLPETNTPADFFEGHSTPLTGHRATLVVANDLETLPDPSTMIFVFGSNNAGIHGAGAAKFAYKHRGAKYGNGFGPMGQSYALPTKDHTIRTLSHESIKWYVQSFLSYARSHPEQTFQVTAVGCGLAGLQHKNIAPMFENAPSNCYFDTLWQQWLPRAKFWGTF